VIEDNAQARKNRSMARLKKAGIPCIDHLPAIESDGSVTLRTKEDICNRAICLALVAVKAEGLEPDVLKKKIEEYQVRTFFTPEENKFIETLAITDKERIKFIWKYEALWVLLWALTYIEELDYPSHICDVPKAVKIIVERGRIPFINDSVIRPKAEILDETDLIFRYHWATTEARLKNIPMPGGLDDGVVYERHYALNWLVCYGELDWDDVTTDT